MYVPIYIFDSYIYDMVMVVVVILSSFFSIMHDLMIALGHIYNLVGALLFWLKIINNLLLKSLEIKVMDDHRARRSLKLKFTSVINSIQSLICSYASHSQWITS